MRRPAMASLIAAWASVLIMIMLFPGALAPAPVQADSSSQPRVQVIGAPGLQQLHLQLATPAPALRLPRPRLATPPRVLRLPRLELATPPPVFRRLPVEMLPRWDRRYIVPTPEPKPDIASCGDTLQGIQWTRIMAPATDAGACFVTIRANPGSTIGFSFNPVLEGLGLQMQVVDTEGEVLFSGQTDSPQNRLVVTFTAPPNGEVTLAVYAAEEGEFEITPQIIYYALTTSLCGGPLQAGIERAGIVSTGGEECWYRYDGQAGHVLTVSMTTDSAQLDPLLKLYDQAGSHLTTADDYGGTRNAQLVYTLPASGQFTVIARDYSHSAGGLFKIEALDEVPPPAATPTPRPTVAPPTSGGGGAVRQGVTMAGQLSTPGQKNVYPFSGIAGQTVKITLEATGGNLDTYLELYDANYPASARLAYSDDNPAAGGRNSQIDSYRLGSTGTYKIVVSSYAGRSAGPYTLTLSQP